MSVLLASERESRVDRVLNRVFPPANPYIGDPDGWATERLGVESWSVPRKIRESVLTHRHTAVPACHESAKTHTAASIGSWWIDIRQVGEAFLVSTAPTGPQVKALLWRDIQSMHTRGKLPGRITLDARWLIDERLVGFGRKTANAANPEEAMQAFQGVHARWPLVIIDEAGGVPKWLFDAADSIAANTNGRVLAIGNPDDPTSHFAEICKPGSKYNVIPISAFDTPAFTGEPVSQNLLDLLISREYVEELAALGTDSHIYQSKVLGRFPDVSDDSLFPPRFVMRAHEADLPGVDRGGYGVDVARFGSDKTVMYRNRGGVLRLVKEIAKQDTEETADMVLEAIGAHGTISSIPVVVDGVGVGAGVVDKLRRKRVKVQDFNGGSKPVSRGKHYKFANRRAEVFWLLREGMENGEVDLDPEDRELAAQLGRIRFWIASGDVVHVERKEDMRKRGVKSPDRADAAAMAFATPHAIVIPEGMRRAPSRVTESGTVMGPLSAGIRERVM